MDAINAYLSRQPAFSSAGLTRLNVAGHAVGWLEPQTVDFLLHHDATFQLKAGQMCVPDGLDINACSALFTAAAVAMRQAGLIRGWRDELYIGYAPTAQGGLDLAQPLFQLERAAFRRFGLVSRAVHINGYTADGLVWVGRRASSKSIDPGKRDNLAAGGLPAGEAPFHCVIRELWEEAGVPSQLAQAAVASGTLRTTRNEADGTHDEVIECFDLLLPPDFVPHNMDGEVADFTAMPPAELIAALDEFTWDAGAVSALFLQRHGWVRQA